MKRFLAPLIAAAATLCAAGTGLGAPAATEVEWKAEAFRDVIYKQIDGRRIKMDIYMPTKGKSEKAPVLYYVHGGGWAAGSKAKGGLPLMRPVFEKVAEHGVVCVSIDYRLFKGRNGVLMRDCLIDAVDGLRFLNENAAKYGIDPDRVVVWGDSAGGQLAQMLNFADYSKFRDAGSPAENDIQPIAGISWYGPSDFTIPDLFKTDLSDKEINRFGLRITGTDGGYAENPKAYEEMSPYFWISKDSPPLLSIQGNKDATIPLAHATHLKEKAEKIGADATFIIVENAGHNWRKVGAAIEPNLTTIQELTADFALKQIEAVTSK
ncbi:alpha/beta hydrolase fold domain-containing protein [Luteolibacter sp. AS25]|uniref:alpha/beta hydrolase fold domain-containing protein n=1 Tax=Luteolibacter sp. AS25 TaxID=3135776 RepID=UPI00398A8F95